MNGSGTALKAGRQESVALPQERNQRRAIHAWPSLRRGFRVRAESRDCADAALVWGSGLPYPRTLLAREMGFSVLLETDDRGIPGGVVHDLPADLEEALKGDAEALATWQDITPLARNEWICWIESAKKAATRRKRIDWGCSSLSDGKRRPCCWPGCPHRTG